MPVTSSTIIISGPKIQLHRINDQIRYTQITTGANLFLSPSHYFPYHKTQKLESSYMLLKGHSNTCTSLKCLMFEHHHINRCHSLRTYLFTTYLDLYDRYYTNIFHLKCTHLYALKAYHRFMQSQVLFSLWCFEKLIIAMPHLFSPAEIITR